MSNFIQNHFDNLLDTEMDRREFLAYCGATLLGVLGVSGLIKTLTASTPQSKQPIAGGYGSSTYGGQELTLFPLTHKPCAPRPTA